MSQVHCQRFDIDPEIVHVARHLRRRGGRALLVGGVVRDLLRGLPAKDFDLEVYGLPLERLEAALSELGEVIAVGRAFGVLKVKGLDADFSIPRRDSKTGRGHRGFVVDLDPELDFTDAARRRDLTVNSIAYDPLTGEILDPFDGRGDLEREVLRATDARTFPEDSLRALRVAQFRARLEMEPDAELVALCRGLDLSDLPGERLYEEIKKLLLKARRPSLGFEFLEKTALLRFFPELEAMVGVAQDPIWHPEGTVWEHTLMVVDEAAALRQGQEAEDLALMFGALCHDIGKPATTFEKDGRIVSPGHDEAGVEPTRSLLGRLRASHKLTDQVVALVRFHLAPTLLPKGGATARGYRRLARRLAEAEVSPRLLYRLARSDHFGRTTPDALARQFPGGDEFLRSMEEVVQPEVGIHDVVLGRHLIARGLRPGPDFGRLLDACREIQDETGWTDPDRILDQVLAGSAER
ncbi:MAG: HD domain-containing protein [Acidobacteria bacterium]|nr:HD domain-containing protein [Acidobacteriota bacterium]